MLVSVRSIGYVRVSTAEQAQSGLGLADQEARLEAEAAMRGWTMRLIVDDGYSAKSLKRPGIGKALDLLAAGKADALIVSKLDRLSRSVLDFTALMERSRKEGWALVALDLGVDTSTPAGEMVATVMASFAQYERRLIGQRTKDALAQLKTRGVRLGGPVLLSEEVRTRIADERKAGRSLAAIADQLTAEGVPTAKGGVRWYPSTVRAVLESVALDAHA